ncbi:uncharacterized protein LOC111699590 [Eurytemora carolleeae]|uniref:uncharacterized protein LOC111699590 n=1 Tax=Eurytemora carolleeae TaxID=1294199 RepID=UPI000C7621E2|nr:uncharacterized protein LOC111699590 [Eurytemora carolleeae]|eukprot:XP_023326061.1 uncharacterized protein LOC111699590 [Eurytemora affinis]
MLLSFLRDEDRGESKSSVKQISRNKKENDVPRLSLSKQFSELSIDSQRSRGGIQAEFETFDKQRKAIMTEDLYYQMQRARVGTAVIINNLDTEQSPTKHDVEVMANVLADIGFNVEIYKDLTSQGMNTVKRKITTESMHRDSNCFLLLLISHGTADNFLLDKNLVGKPKLFFIEACRGKEQNQGMVLMSKSSAPKPAPAGITLPSKQDVFVGFATVPGYVSLTASGGSPYLQTLANELSQHALSKDLSDIHLLVKRKLAGMKLGPEGVTQGAEERSSLLSKLMFSKYNGKYKGSITDGGKSWSWFSRSPAELFRSSSSSRLDSSQGLSSRSSSPASRVDISKEVGSHALTRGKANLSKDKTRPSSEIFTQQTNITQDRPRSIFFSPGLSPTSVSRSSSSPSAVAASAHRSFESSLRTETACTKSTNVYTIEVNSTDIEAGLNLLLNKVKEVYGGEGKIKIKKKNKDKMFSFKYKGPERAANLLETALQKVKELQDKGPLWRFTQTLEVTTLK